MSKSIGYKPAPTNKDIGGATHGSFKMSGNKKGRKGAIASKPSREKLTPPHNVDTKIKMMMASKFPAFGKVHQTRYQGKA